MPKKSKKNIKKTTRKIGLYNLKKTFKTGNRIKDNNSSKKLRKIKQKKKGGSNNSDSMDRKTSKKLKKEENRRHILDTQARSLLEFLPPEYVVIGHDGKLKLDEYDKPNSPIIKEAIQKKKKLTSVISELKNKFSSKSNKPKSN
jgi:hypothetical protein